MPSGSQVPHVATEQGSLRLRMRLSKPSLVVDCSTTRWSVPLSDALFWPAVEIVRPAGTGSGASLPWSICLGDAKVPLSAGDVVKIESNVHPVSRDRVLRVERVQSGGREPAERVALWLLRGNPSTLPAAGWDATLLSLTSNQREDGCGAFVRAGCGTVESGAQVAVQIERRATALQAGETIDPARPRGRQLGGRDR